MKRKLDVYLDHSFVGCLSQTEQGLMEFVYEGAWLANANALSLSWSLPLRQEPFNQKECRGFFGGILPEEANREIIARILGISARNDYAMLEQIGGECAGAVTFLPARSELPESDYGYRLLDEDALAEILTNLPRRPLLAGVEGIRLSLAGAQNKIVVRVEDNGAISIPTGGAPSTHILKTAIERFPHSVSNESLCLELADAIGIPAAKSSQAFAGEVEYILVERYDRKNKESEYPHRLHQEDFCQALGIPSEIKYQREGGPSLQACFSLIRDASSFPAIDIQNLLNTVIFNLIIGNHDAHGKNFSLLYEVANERVITRLAPAYDLLSTVYYEELSPKMAMKIGKEYESQKLNLQNIERFASEAGLGVAGVRKRCVDVAMNVQDKLPSMEDKYTNVHDLITLIESRAAWLVDVVKR